MPTWLRWSHAFLTDRNGRVMFFLRFLCVCMYILYYFISSESLNEEISFTLYPAHRRVGRDSPFPTFCRILEALLVEWQNSTTHFASTPERKNGNINLNKYLISSSGIEPTSSRFYSHTLCPCATTGLNHWMDIHNCSIVIFVLTRC